MANVGRNQPCPCGSGKKYKVCCLRSDEVRRDAARAKEAARVLPIPRRPWPPAFAENDDLDQLDEHSNRVVDLIHAGRLDDAEAAAQELLTRYPGLMDGHLRLAMVCEARNQPKLAAAHYRDAAACLEDDCGELRADLLRQAEKLAPAE